MIVFSILLSDTATSFAQRPALMCQSGAADQTRAGKASVSRSGRPLDLALAYVTLHAE